MKKGGKVGGVFVRYMLLLSYLDRKGRKGTRNSHSHLHHYSLDSPGCHHSGPARADSVRHNTGMCWVDYIHLQLAMYTVLH